MEPSAYSVSLEIQNVQEVEITSHGPALCYHEEEVKPISGVSLTWNDLWVTVADGKSGGSRSILQGVTGYARPGEILAIMGPSGSGKSTLLDALAGRLDSKTRQSGDILVNGFKKSLAYGTSAYVTQDETLITTLTVRESVYYSAQLQLPDSMSKAEKKERAEMTIREMGLQDSMDTRIGGAASYYVMSRIARLDQHQGRTIVASIHQPCSEVFELFHNLCLLSSGRTVYFGDANFAKEFFSSNGFPCPSFQNPSDHFLRTINKDFDEDIEQGSSGRKPTEDVINSLIDSYKSSTTFQEVNSRVAEICKKGDGRLEKKTNHASFSTQCFVLTRRSFINMHRDLGYYWLRFAIYIALSLGLGTLFYHVGSSYSSVEAKSSMLMFVVSFLTFMTIGGFPSFVEDMKVFERERLNGHYGTGAFVIANTLSSTPYLLLLSVIPGALAYYLTGLRGGFFRLPNDLPHPFWKYPLFYIGFHKYAYQGLFKNEFEGGEYVYNNGGVPKTVDGEYILKATWQVEMGYSKWIDLVILFGMVVISRVWFWVIVKIVEKVKSDIRGLLFGVPKKQRMQVMVNPLATPSH
ncbi:AAA+ ATPase domain-containing protein [Cynara cardunculus var. scolymus]|uniref:AAA+ ATPase domain-containing protein n=1 Tax=Cynara cardunculus var. scolymus TaxID=59895 RepID=A0A103YKW3_CYNCS|nr:AAA+ ATPase domain-containing protein [Cynara cardunculus var. scolymus]